ncbi:MAG: 50S ribosomal protein L3 [Coxiella sp. RIFCSPHIGHO2_12_FULL_44_14]|nr:MAG: 50S ribosomal protein L3 [Coxiella sp. RIFCSPHIGHO2_12_FULL_44_14]
MSMGLVGKKCGMTQLFDEAGVSVPVTVVVVVPNRVVQVKTLEHDGYRALQVAGGRRSAARVNKPMAGHFTKADVELGDSLREFRLAEGELPEAKVGDQFSVALFTVGQKVNVRGLTRGKGFAGVIKRHHFKMGDASHGNSLSHRAPGSIGQRQTPGRVFKGKKMAGHMGNVYRTAQNQEIIQVNVEHHRLLIKGAIPGAPGSSVVITCSNRNERGH